MHVIKILYVRCNFICQSNSNQYELHVQDQQFQKNIFIVFNQGQVNSLFTYFQKNFYSMNLSMIIIAYQSLSLNTYLKSYRDSVLQQMNITLKLKNGIKFGQSFLNQPKKYKQNKPIRKEMLLPTNKPYIEVKNIALKECEQLKQNDKLKTTFDDSMIRSEDGEILNLDSKLTKIKSCDFKKSNSESNLILNLGTININLNSKTSPHVNQQICQKLNKKHRSKNFSLEIEDIILRDTQLINEGKSHRGQNKETGLKQKELRTRQTKKNDAFQAKSMLQIFNCKNNMKKNRKK